MNFVHLETGSVSNVPWVKTEASVLGYHAYSSLESCGTCKCNPLVRFTETDECVQCVMSELNDTWNLWEMGNPGKPDPFPRSIDDAIRFGVDYYYTPRMCNKGRHFITPHIRTGKCQACSANKPLTPDQIIMRDYPNMIIEKDLANTFGYKIFRTGLPCRKGHKGWRYISSGACVSCIQGVRTVIELCIGVIPQITINQQLSMFIGYAYHSKKFHDSQGRKWNKLQFDAMFPDIAKYETKQGLVDRASDAFIANFL